MDTEKFLKRCAKEFGCSTIVDMAAHTKIGQATLYRWFKRAVRPKKRPLMKMKYALKRLKKNDEIVALITEIDQAASQQGNTGNANC